MKIRRLISALLLTAVTGGFVAALKLVDVKSVGPEGTAVGLSTINTAVHEMIGTHILWYKITEVLGLLALAVAGLFALKGFIQLVRRRSLFKVDKRIIALGVLYAAVVVLYVVFEKVVINYRPVIMPGDAHVEPSFPSSHTMMAIVIFASAIMLLKYYIREEKSRKILQIILGVELFLTVFGRLLSGVHWLTDIVGGVLISMTLLAYFSIFADSK